MVPTGLDGDRVCVGDRVQGSGVVWHHGGIGGWSSVGVRFILHLGNELAENNGRLLMCGYEALSLVFAGKPLMVVVKELELVLLLLC